MQSQDQIIIAQAVPESERLDAVDKLFGIRFPLALEPTIYRFAEQLAPDYTGGYWHFYRLTNGGFYMAPNLDGPFAVVADNGFAGTMSPDALGMTACLYTFSNLSFSKGRFGEVCAGHYHWLLDYAMQCPEAGVIRAAID